MTRTTLLRRTILQLEQILLTDDLTFIVMVLYFNRNVMRPRLRS
jgi:hypothetical protein